MADLKCKNNSAKTVLIYAFCALVSLILLILTTGADLGNLASVPFTYNRGDSITVLFRTHEMSNGSFLFGLNDMGYPSVSNSYNSYAMDFLLLVIQYILAVIIPNQILSYNIFVLLSPVLTSLSAFYALNRLGEYRKPVNFILAVIYSLLPYYFIRSIDMGHVYLGFVFAIPVASVIAREIYDGRFQIKKISSIVWLLVIGMTGVYYAVFSCFFFLLAAVMHGLREKKLKSFGKDILPIGVVFISFLLASVPTLISWAEYGSSAVSDTRNPAAGEIYSVKLIQLFLPAANHRISLLSYLRDTYYHYFPANESESASLGFFMAAGLAVLLISFFVPKSEKSGKILEPFALFSLAALLLGCTGGLSTVLGIVFPLIRCYNRISVFIGFFGLVAAGYFVNLLFEKMMGGGKILRCSGFAVLAAVMLLAVFDQAPAVLNTTEDGLSSDNFFEDTAFTSAIESYFPEDDIDLLTVPFAKFPENGTVGNMSDYEFMDLPITSDRISISYGSDSDYCEDGISSAIDYARENGFEGIVVCTDAYSADEWSALSDEITSELGASDASSSQYVFWSLQ